MKSQMIPKLLVTSKKIEKWIFIKVWMFFNIFVMFPIDVRETGLRVFEYGMDYYHFNNLSSLIVTMSW